MYKDSLECIDCANSFVDDADELYCVIKGQVVADDDGCEDFN